MSSETSSVRLAALALRVTLGVIFLWHGIDKLRSDNWSTWGASWADEAQKRASKAPPQAIEKMEKLKDDHPREWVLTGDKTEEVSDEKAKELAEKREKDAERMLNRAYAADTPEADARLQSAAIQYAVTWGEVLGGAALLLGLLTRLAALGLIVIQAGAIYFVTRQLGLTGQGVVGYEYNLALIAMCLVLLIEGPGGWSVDHFLHWGRSDPKQPAAQQPAIAKRLQRAAYLIIIALGRIKKAIDAFSHVRKHMIGAKQTGARQHPHNRHPQ